MPFVNGMRVYLRRGMRELHNKMTWMLVLFIVGFVPVVVVCLVLYAVFAVYSFFESNECMSSSWYSDMAHHMNMGSLLVQMVLACGQVLHALFYFMMWMVTRKNMHLEASSKFPDAWMVLVVTAALLYYFNYSAFAVASA